MENATGLYHHVGVVYNGVDIVCCLNQRKASMSEGNDTRVHAYAFNDKTNLCDTLVRLMPCFSM